MKQIALPLDWPGRGEDSFLLSASNRRAAEQLQHWATWPVMSALLVGPPKSGRSLLARIFAAQFPARVIDDAEQAEEEAIFHAWNRAQAERRPLLIVADAAPPAWPVLLPDLRSRLAATPVLRLEDPDEALVEQLLVLLLQRRGLDPRPDLLRWLTARVERSHQAVVQAVELLDREATARRQRLSIPLARATLSGAGLLAERSPEHRNQDR